MHNTHTHTHTHTAVTAPRSVFFLTVWCEWPRTEEQTWDNYRKFWNAVVVDVFRVACPKRWGTKKKIDISV